MIILNKLISEKNIKMNDTLEKLVGQIVNARIIIDDDIKYVVVGEVLKISVDDYYFYEKGESIYIAVSIKPLEDLPVKIDSESIISIPIDYITKH